MGDFSVKFLHFKEKIMFKSHKIKLNQIILKKNIVNTHGAPVFASSYSATILAPQMCTFSHEHSMYIRFLYYFTTALNYKKKLFMKLTPARL
jgi:hypothetical protein